MKQCFQCVAMLSIKDCPPSIMREDLGSRMLTSVRDTAGNRAEADKQCVVTRAS
jgi:hypothetical protein